MDGLLIPQLVEGSVFSHTVLGHPHGDFSTQGKLQGTQLSLKKPQVFSRASHSLLFLSNSFSHSCMQPHNFAVYVHERVAEDINHSAVF